MKWDKIVTSWRAIVLAESRFVIQLAVGLVFLASTVSKLYDPGSFARGLAEFKLLHHSFTGFVSCLIIVTEGWLAISHLTGYRLTISLPIGLIMLASFGLAVTINLRRGRVLPCHCFGGSGETISARTIVRLLLLISAESLLLVTHRVRYLRQFTQLTEFVVELSMAIVLLVLCLWLLDLGDLLKLQRRVSGLWQETSAPDHQRLPEVGG
jgi:hypothetical protein